mmetsp:Transcript_91795/g.259182  ORF Transcript_91795/g.259182 Transcript_91795/m.259182 type:complete len:533 (-) Transcript_91795:123-1721(-)
MACAASGGMSARSAAASRAVRFLALAAAALTGRVSAGGGGAILTLAPVDGGKAKHHPAVLAEWSELKDPIEGLELVRASEEDPYGCTAQPKCDGCALLVLQGNCTFALKARRAEDAGAEILVVSSKADGAPVGMAAGPVKQIVGGQRPRIAAVMISKAAGRQAFLALGRNEMLEVSVKVRPGGKFGDIMSEAFVGALATGLVMLGAWYSIEDLRHPEGERSRLNEEVMAVEEQSGPRFVIFGSIMLTVLFFFMKYLIYVLLFFFASGALSTTAALLEPVVGGRCPKLRKLKAFSLPSWLAYVLGVDEDHTCADAVASGVGAVLAVSFLVYRNNDTFGWALQDIIAILLLLTIQRSLRLPNLKVATTLLVCTFFFDIFWVFLSPLIFKKSVMIEVATGGGTGQSVPMVLKIPAMVAGFPGQFKILGLGDVAIPGLLISFLLRHDVTQGNARGAGYFTAGVVGYALGLFATFISLYLMQHGQPALLFLVPGTLLPTFAIAARKGELRSLWTIDYSPEQPPEGYDKLSDGVDKQA